MYMRIKIPKQSYTNDQMGMTDIRLGGCSSIMLVTLITDNINKMDDASLRLQINVKESERTKY